MNALSPSDRRRLVASAALLSSDLDGEALAATRAVCRQLGKHGLSPAQVLAVGLQEVSGQNVPKPKAYSPPPCPASILRQHQRTARMALAFPELLTAWEAEFLESIACQRGISQRQQDALNRIASKIERARK